MSPGEKGRKTRVNLGDAQKGLRERGPRSSRLNMERRKRERMESARVVGVFGSRAAAEDTDGGPGYNVIRLLPVERIASR